MSAALRFFQASWGQIVVAVAALASIRLYTEALGVEAFGVVMLLLGLLALADSVGTLALTQALFGVCGRHADPTEQARIADRLSRAFALRAAPAYAVMGAVGGGAATLVTRDPEWLVLPVVTAVYVAADAAKSSRLTPLLLSKRFAAHSMWVSIEAVGTVATVLAVLHLRTPDPVTFLLGYVAARAAYATTLVACSGGFHRSAAGAVQSAERTEAVRLAKPVALMGPLGWLSGYLDRYAVGATLGVADTGRYAAVSGTVGRPYALSTSILTNLYRPMLYVNVDDPERAAERRRASTRWTGGALLFGVLGIGAFAVLGNLVSHLLLAPEFRKGAPSLMIVLAAAQAISITTHAADNVLLSSAQGGRLLRIQVFSALVTLVAVPVGAVLGSVLGAATGRALAELVKCSASYFAAFRLLRCEIKSTSRTVEGAKT